MGSHKKSRSPGLLAIVVALSALLAIATLAGCAGGYYEGSVAFVDAQHGWVTWGGDGRTVVSRTLDGGATWQEVGSRKSRPIVGWAAFSTPTTGVWAVEIDKLLYTTTGGRPWHLATVKGMKGGYFAAASFASAKVGWAAGVHGQAKAGGSIAKTTDGGATWRVQKRISGKDGSGGFLDVACPSVLKCYALKRGTLGGVWATSNGGATWTRHKLPGTSVYEAIDFVDGVTGYAVGNSGKIAKTTDGGVTWVLQASGVSGRLHGVCFTSVDNGFAVGANGVILHTQDGGAQWAAQSSETTVTLNSVDFVSSDEGWVVGADGWRPLSEGTMLHTTDAGQTWK